MQQAYVVLSIGKAQTSIVACRQEKFDISCSQSTGVMLQLKSQCSLLGYVLEFDKENHIQPPRVVFLNVSRFGLSRFLDHSSTTTTINLIVLDHSHCLSQVL